MSSTEIKSAVLAAEPDKHIARALNGKLRYSYQQEVDNFISPSKVFNALATSYSLLRKRPSKPLANHKVEGEYVAGSLDAFLAQTINQSIEAATVPDDVFDILPSGPKYSVRDHCMAAERGFTTTALHLGSTAATLYLTANGSPLFLRKYPPNGVSTSLSLQTTRFAGVVFPAGTIYDVVNKGSEEAIGLVIPGEDHVLGVQHIASAHPLRLSRFALNDTDRNRSFTQYDEVGFKIQPEEFNTTTQNIADLVVSHFTELTEIPSAA